MGIPDICFKIRPCLLIIVWFSVNIAMSRRSRNLMYIKKIERREGKGIGVALVVSVDVGVGT